MVLFSVRMPIDIQRDIFHKVTTSWICQEVHRLFDLLLNFKIQKFSKFNLRWNFLKISRDYCRSIIDYFFSLNDKNNTCSWDFHLSSFCLAHLFQGVTRDIVAQLQERGVIDWVSLSPIATSSIIQARPTSWVRSFLINQRELELWLVYARHALWSHLALVDS